MKKYRNCKSNQSSINRNNQDFLSLLNLFSSKYTCNQQNIILTGLRICTQDILNTIQKGYKQVRVKQNQTILKMKAVLLNSVCSLDVNRRN